MFPSPPERRDGQLPVDDARVGNLGKYQVFARLGQGGMADVYLALVSGLAGVNKLAVIKRLRDNDDAFVEMFVDEARLAALLNHPNIVHTYEAGESPAGYYIAMEYLDGQPLNAVLGRARKAPGVLPPELGLHVVCEALAGLHYAHELCDFDGRPLGIVHRDVSPHNMFLTYAGDVKLVDFGIAKAASNSTVTATGVIKGKLRYMAPEQARGLTDRRSDLFAMGAVLWEIATGERLFKGDELQVLSALMGEPIPAASAARPAIDPALDAVIARALERDPERRYQTAEQMRGDLMACLPRAREVGTASVRKLLDDLFGEAREESRRRVHACLARLREESLPPGAPHSAVYDALPDLWQRVTTDATVDASRRASVSTDEPPPERAGAGGPRLGRALAVVLVGASAIAAFAVVGGAASRRSRAAPALAASAGAAPAPEAPAPARAEKVAVTIETEPPGAVVSLGGKPLGKSPVRIDVERSKHTFVVTKEGFQPEELVVDGAQGGGAVSRLVRLQPAPEARTSRRYVPPPAVRRTPSSPAAAPPEGGRPAAPGTASTPAPPTARVRVIADEDVTKNKVKVVGD